MSCSFDESNDVQTSERRKARKEHKCSACREKILPGQIYILDKALYDGSWSQVKRCARCQLIYAHLQSLKWDYMEGPDWKLNCGHEYSEVWGVDPPPEIAELAFLTPEEAQARLT